MTLTRLTKELDNLNKNDGDGVLILSNHTVVWNLYLTCGKLLYATSEVHPVRRWDRALKQHCPNWNWGVDFSQLSKDLPWECHILAQGISQRQLSAIQAKLVIRNIVQECFFELNSYADFRIDWQPRQKQIWHLSMVVIPLSSWEILSVVNKATNMQQKWQAAGLGHLNPTVAPVFKPGVEPQALPILEKYLNSQFTLWDIASEQEKSVIEVTLSLIPSVEKGILEFQNIPDLQIPTVKQTVAATLPQLKTQSTKFTQKQPLIACIDDSPVLAHTLKKILIPAGYEMLSIPEPMRGFSQLIEHKPDLILLDLLLPNADGYSICKFLRDTPVFKETPIIILTGQNTPIDRAHASLVGATEFLGKPPQPQELLYIVQKFLG
ncbi:response regulator [Plectonema radiosum NIES-515]|uniref:Protein PatA n=1 Tax=Plectonema radiosum NIES-515 TaxID=2986073 RepID=A0ABT3B0Z1_9CYAN|nr:response regulator [Plectonema radiosum]MCV3215045.1 response regulator [Plectonema radiosum NIES-515]